MLKINERKSMIQESNVMIKYLQGTISKQNWSK